MTAKRKREWFILAVFVLGLGGCFALMANGGSDGASSSPPATQEPVPVELKITGTSTHVDETFTQPSGDISQQSGRPVPDTWTGKYRSGSFVEIDAQDANDDGATTRCQIVVGGIVIASNSSSGSFTIASCSATVP